MKTKKQDQNKPRKIAIITYNRIGEGQYDNGIMKLPGKNLELYIAQNGHRSKWAANGGSDRDREETRHLAAKHAVMQLKQEMGIADMDHVYLYVGSNGGEEAIRQSKEIPPKKITYVMCDCNYGRKRSMIREIGNAAAKIMDCECGGQHTLDKILRELLD